MNDWSFGTRNHQLHQRHNDASPHTNYLFEFLKNDPRLQRPGGKTFKYSANPDPVNARALSNSAFHLEGRAV
jgi:hypothetical protein